MGLFLIFVILVVLLSISVGIQIPTNETDRVLEEDSWLHFNRSSYYISYIGGPMMVIF